jgi:hypothetical protein
MVNLIDKIKEDLVEIDSNYKADESYIVFKQKVRCGDKSEVKYYMYKPKERITEKTKKKYKYGDIIILKQDAKPELTITLDMFLESDEVINEKTYNSLPLDAFEFDYVYEKVYLKPEYASEFIWHVDEQFDDLLNISVAYPEGDVNPGSFCSFISVNDVETINDD